MRALPAAAVLVAFLHTVVGSAAGDQSSSSVTVMATFADRSAVRASTANLAFHVVRAGEPALATVEFVASARTRSGAGVQLVVEPAAIVGPGGVTEVETRLALEGDADGVIAGDIPLAVPSTAARWTGSGQRRGRLVFSLRAPTPGVYSVPLSLGLIVR